MATYTKFQQFVENLAEKVFNLGTDQLKVALTNTVPVNTFGTLSQITEIAYTNLSSRNITTVSSAQTAGVYKLVIADLVLTASGAVPTFEWVVIYSDTATNDELICYFDYGSAITMATGETFTIDSDQSAGLLTIT